MSLRHLYKLVMRRIWYVLAGAVTGSACAMVVTSMITPTYESSASIYVYAPRPASELGDAYQGTLYTQQQVKAYADLARTRAVLEPAAQNLNPAPAIDDLKKQLTVQVPLDSVILHISVIDADKQRAVATANIVAQELVDYVDQMSRQAKADEVKLDIVDPAQPASEPYSPNRALNLAAGLLAGAALGLLVGTLLSRFDQRINTVEQLNRIVPAPVLARVPREKGVRKGSDKPRKIDGFSSYAEAYRKLRANLTFLGADLPRGILVVTSGSATEGKSTVSLDLARSLTKGGESCLLLDADLRRPTLAKRLGLTADAGLTSVLAGRAELASVLQNYDGLSVLTSGPIPPNPSELLSGNVMAELLAKVGEQYDYVILDSAPLLPVADTRVLASLVDGVLLVVRQRHTRREGLTESVGALKSAGARILGVVHNGIDVRQGSYYYGEDLKTYASAGEPSAPLHTVKVPSGRMRRRLSRRK